MMFTRDLKHGIVFAEEWLTHLVINTVSPNESNGRNKGLYNVHTYINSQIYSSIYFRDNSLYHIL